MRHALLLAALAPLAALAQTQADALTPVLVSQLRPDADGAVVEGRRLLRLERRHRGWLHEPARRRRQRQRTLANLQRHHLRCPRKVDLGAV